MNWKRMLAYVTGSVDEELRLRNEYLVTENRILRDQIHGRVRVRSARGHHQGDQRQFLAPDALHFAHPGVGMEVGHGENLVTGAYQQIPQTLLCIRRLCCNPQHAASPTILLAANRPLGQL